MENLDNLRTDYAEKTTLVTELENAKADLQ